MLSDLTNYIEENKDKGIIIAGDFNKQLYSKNIQSFLIDNRLFKVHNLLNGTESIKRDNTYIEWSKYIDFVVVTSSIVKFINGYELINYN